MDINRQNSVKQATVMQLWRKAGVDFDHGCKSSLAQLLELGGYFPLCKVEDRLPLSRNSLHQWARGLGDEAFVSCFVPIRAKGRIRAMTILVDLVRLNGLLAALVQDRIADQTQEPKCLGHAPAPSQESA